MTRWSLVDQLRVLWMDGHQERETELEDDVTILEHDDTTFKHDGTTFGCDTD